MNEVALISIHALREEGDPGLGDKWFQDHQISIHALREEGDILIVRNVFLLNVFLSTPSARRATADCQRNKTRRHQFLSTPSARRAT